MNASEMTFGVEIETVAPESAVREHGLRIGGYRRGTQVPYLPDGWTAEQDSSINAGHGHRCEIVSPVLRGVEGLAQVQQVVEALVAKGHRVNASCGVHVHIGWPAGLSDEALARLVTIVAYCEPALFAITGTKHRERCVFCGGVRHYGGEKPAKDRMTERRYHALNLTNLAEGRKRTVEFRVFSGSLNVIKILGWIQVCLGLVERAIAAKRRPSWSPKAPSGGWKKAGPGQSETERLIGYLAWGPGYARIHNGRQFGWLGGPIAQDAVKAEFRRLAKKYDAEA
jgi:hypothetical protein